MLTQLSKRVIAGLATVSLIVVTISGLIYTSITQLIASSSWVAHSYQVIDTLDQTEDYFTDAQSAERGYVATCRQSLISPFRRDVPLIFARLATLRTLTEDNPNQSRRVTALTTALNDELARMTGVIATNLKGDVKAAEGMLVDDKNARATQNVLATIEAMETEERGLLATRLHSVRTFASLTLVASIGGTLVCFGILAFVFWFIRRETARRADSEASLQETNGRLETSLDDLKHHNAAARTVSLLAELLQSCRSTTEALSITATHLSGMLPDVTGAIGLFNNSRDRVEVIQTIGASAAFALDFPPDGCWGLRRGRIHLHNSGNSEPLCDHLTPRDEGYLCLPMIAQGELLGVLSLGMPRELTVLERQTLQTIGEQLSLAIASLRMQETLRFQSLRDQLTGLFNRRYLNEALVREVARAKRHSHPVAMVMIDIDHFKRFNDTYGHEGGDALLAAFGKLLAVHARGEDLACRYGGEEFALIMPGATAAAAAERVDKLRDAVTRLQVSLHGRPLGPVTMSAGVSEFPTDGDGGEMVLARADRALYQAKKLGRNRVIVDTSGAETETIPQVRAS